ncbi:MAG: DUF421 domain-containing protein [Chloroflexota bacterium]|nr:DUF421 domain-containing protein [Chloroflexota bacterium]
MLSLSVPWWEIVLRTAIVYIVVLALLRLSGKRELGQMTTFDLVVILVIANAVQNAMTGGDNSLLGGVLAASTLVAMNLTVARVERRVPAFARIVAGEPTLLAHDGKVIEAHLKRENVTREEVEMAAREHGADGLRDVTAAILEIDGSISIITKGQKVGRSRRQVRQLRQR